jgi:flagellin-like protein
LEEIETMTTQKSMQARRWRKKQAKGVSPIIATILLVAITVVLAAVLYILISGLTKGPGNTPIGTAISFGKVAESTFTTQWNYTTSVQTATAGMTWANMIFQVQGPSGILVTSGLTKVVISGTSGCNLATFTMGATNTWGATGATCTGVTTGGSALVQSGQTLQLQTSVNLNGQGDQMVIIGQGSYSGSSILPIP